MSRAGIVGAGLLGSFARDKVHMIGFSNAFPPYDAQLRTCLSHPNIKRKGVSFPFPRGYGAALEMSGLHLFK